VRVLTHHLFSSFPSTVFLIKLNQLQVYFHTLPFFDVFFFAPSFSHLVWFYVSSIPRAFSYALKPAAAAEAVEPTAEQQQHFSS
jgi:hypothetical protein